MNKRTCSVPDCGRPHAAKGYCHMHWGRWKRQGNPLVSMRGQTHKVEHTEDGLRICKACGEAKPLSEYHRDKNASGGYRAQCKPCRSGYMKGYYETVVDERREYMRKRMAERGDHIRELDRKRYERDKDKRIALASEAVKVRRARLAGVETDPGVTVPALRKIHGDNCCYCGVEMTFQRGKRGDGIAPNRATLEHVLPITKGGGHTFENTALACHRCNVSKNDKTVAEWEAWKKGGAEHGREEAASTSPA